MTTSEDLPSVKLAVEREAHRRKRVFATFLALLIIPIAIGLYAVAKAPSDTDVVVSNVTPIVEKNVEENITARVDQKIEPRVEEIVERRAAPVIERTLDKAVAARVQPLERQYRVLAVQRNTERQETAERVKILEARVAALEERLARLTNTRVPPGPKTDRPPLTHVPAPKPQ
jgi:polyhydroxyalkanoate synthesis regulator phasin